MQFRLARRQAVSAVRFATLILAFVPALAAAQAGATATPPKGATTIDAERIESASELEVTARGRVELRRDDLNVFSDFLRYNREFGRIEADGGVRLEQGGDRFFGPRLRYDSLNETGVFEAPNYLIRRNQTARGNASRLEFLSRDRLHLEDANYTTCEPGKEDWRIEARELDLDYDNSVGRGRDLRMRFYDTTVLALPYATFPLENRRKSGFLAPHIAQSSSRGLQLDAPYYWNISPERDLTLTPVLMADRGAQLKGHYRYLDPKYLGSLHLEYMPDDRKFNDSRSGISLLHDHRFLPNLTGNINYNYVSDDRYFVDLSTQVRTVSIGNLPQEGSLNYSGGLLGGSYYLQGKVQKFQTLQDPLSPTTPPYERVPQFLFGLARNEIAQWLDLAVPGEYVRFSHPSLVEGARTTLSPTLSLPLLAPGYFVLPKAGLRAVSYDLQNVAPGQPRRQNVNIPWLSVDGGLIFDRPARLFGEAVTQTLEPRFYYVYVPYRAQDQIPVFDTALADFNYSQLFTENRFAGGDRFGDANQYTLALTSRVLGADGREALRATIGQRYYKQNERVGLTPTSTLRTSDSSDLLASLGGRLHRDWTFDGTVQFDTHQDRWQRYGAALRYSPEIAKVVNASYRYLRGEQRMIDLSGQWPFATGWYAVGRYTYSIQDKVLLEGLAGVEHNAGCWVFRAVVQRIQAATQVSSTAFYLQLEFNGLGQVGTGDAADFLRRNLPGYAPTNPANPALAPPSLRRALPFEQVF
jgi:LPS-assembly protein